LQPDERNEIMYEGGRGGCCTACYVKCSHSIATAFRVSGIHWKNGFETGHSSDRSTVVIASWNSWECFCIERHKNLRTFQCCFLSTNMEKRETPLQAMFLS